MFKFVATYFPALKCKRQLGNYILSTSLLFFYCILSACTNVPSYGDVQTEMDESLSRKRAKIRLELATGYYNNGQVSIALDEVKQALISDQTLFEAHNLRGLIYMKLNELILAEESFQRALQINPYSGGVQHNYGWLLCQQSKWKDSINQFSKALANVTYLEKSKTWMTMGICQMRSDALNDALISLSRSYELEPINPITTYNLSLVHFKKKDFNKALQFIKKINVNEYINAETIWLEIKINRVLGNSKEVSSLGSKLGKNFPGSKEYHFYEAGDFND